MYCFNDIFYDRLTFNSNNVSALNKEYFNIYLHDHNFPLEILPIRIFLQYIYIYNIMMIILD